MKKISLVLLVLLGLVMTTYATQSTDQTILIKYKDIPLLIIAGIILLLFSLMCFKIDVDILVLLTFIFIMIYGIYTTFEACAHAFIAYISAFSFTSQGIVFDPSIVSRVYHIDFGSSPLIIPFLFIVLTVGSFAFFYFEIGLLWAAIELVMLRLWRWKHEKDI